MRQVCDVTDFRFREPPRKYTSSSSFSHSQLDVSLRRDKEVHLTRSRFLHVTLFL